MGETTIAVSNGTYLVEGIQLRPRKFVPKRFGDFILWLFFHRLDTQQTLVIKGLSR